MRIQEFLQHHGIATNPFADEDAQTDLVFKTACIRSVYHPAWDKIYGDPSEPATAVVFGEKGSGKTAIRLQIARHLADHNADHPQQQVFVVPYDDLNPFLDRFRERFSARRRRRPDRVLSQWQLWDHIDAILALAVTQLVDRLLGVRDARHPAARDEPLDCTTLDGSQKRDVLLLAACYDQSTADNRLKRWHQLRRKLGFSVWTSYWDIAVGVVTTAIVLVAIALLGGWSWLLTLWPYLAIAAGWSPCGWRLLKWTWKAWQIARSTRTLRQTVPFLRRMLMRFPAGQLEGQPLPVRAATDDRYAMLDKLQGVLRTLGFAGIVVLVDRVDEPYLVNGSSDLMRALIWPMLDNKLLKHPGLGVKLLLPSELERLLDREDRDFHQRARLDKQNMIRSLAWTGDSLLDLARARVKACAAEGATPDLLEMFDSDVDVGRLREAFGLLRVPRNVFRFMYRLLTAHCNAHSQDRPEWKISRATFESVLALYQRDQEAFERGLGAG